MYITKFNVIHGSSSLKGRIITAKLARMEHFVETAFVTDRVFRAIIDDQELVMDSPEGGPSAGPGPKKLMLASLAGCTGIDVVSILEKMRVEFSHFKIAVSAELTNEHPKVYNAVHIIYTIRVQEEDQPKVKKAVDLSREKYCGVMAMFEKFSTVTFEINFI